MSIICIKCNIEKFYDEFNKDKTTKSGYKSKCRECIINAKICGIYKITSPSGKIYVGQSKDIKNRWSSYKTRGAKKQVVLERSFEKYGIEKHNFEILEECLVEDLDYRERYWQEKFKVVGRNGLNCHYIKIDGKPKIITEESRLKKSLSKMGCLNSQSKEVIDISNFIYYYSASEASIYVDLNKNYLKDMLRGKVRNKTNLIYVDDYEKGLLPNTLFKPKVSRRKTKEGYEIIDYVTGDILGDTKTVSEKYNISETLLRAYLKGVCTNKTDFIYKKDYDKGLKPSELFKGSERDIKSIDFITKTIFNTIKEASIFYKVSDKYIISSLKNTKESSIPIILLDNYDENIVYNYTPERFEKRNTTILNLNNGKKYKNHREVSEDLGISKHMVNKFLTFKCYNIHNIIYERDYIKGLMPNSGNINKGNKEVVDLTTNIKYKSIREACRELGLGKSKQSMYLRDKKYDMTTLRYVC